jgi:hypothetical protein
VLHKRKKDKVPHKITRISETPLTESIYVRGAIHKYLLILISYMTKVVSKLMFLEEMNNAFI